MQITNLKINQYKSIKSLNLSNLSGVNIFIGPNNSGKSNVLDAIESIFLPNDKACFFADQSSDYSVEIELCAEAKKFWQTNERVLIAKRLGGVKSYFLGKDDAPPPTPPVRGGRRRSSPLIGGVASGKTKINNLKKVEQFFIQRTVRFNSRLIENVVKIRKDYADLKLNYQAAFKKLWRVFHQIFPDIDEIVSTEISDKTSREIKAKLKQGGKIVEFSRLGTGVRRIFVMMLYVFHPRYTIILMNEPETHLHPALIKKISKLLAANTKNEQVFFTTHSPIFITPNNLQQVFRVSKKSRQKTEIYYCTNKDDINSKRLVQEFNADNLEMFFADKVVIVEGVSDKILISGLIDKFYQGKKEIKVISVAGKDNIGIYIKLMNIFQIPYLILLDRDALYGQGVGALRPYMKYGAIKRHKKRRGRHQKIRYSSAAAKTIEELKKHHIYVLPNGTIEKNYPRKYQRRDTKPLNALYAVSQITEADFYSAGMRNLREVVEAL